MKKTAILMIAMIFAAALAGCGNKAEQQTANEEPAVGMANPWKYDVSAQEVKDLTGAEFIVPEGASDVTYGIMESDKLAEMNFTLGDARFEARMKPTSDFEDISGLFYEWDAEGVDKIGDADAQIRLFFEENISNVLWFDGERMYSLFTNGADQEGEEALRVSKLVYGVSETGDAEETEVAEAEDARETKDITDENGITVTDMEIMINTPETLTFEFTLNNPDGKDVTFDQTKIKLENYDGTELYPFKDEKEPIDASAQVERHSYTMDIGNVKNGDEISVYYDGKYASSIFVTGGPIASDTDLSGMEDFFSNIDLEEYTKMVMEQAKEGEKQFPVKLEVKESSKDVNPVDGGLFITSDKVECRSLKLSCPNDVYSFGMELYNNTGSDKTFDQTKFVIEKEKGVYLNPFVFEQVREPETVGGDTKRLWTTFTIYDPKGVKAGDEVSVYYDGVFITKLTVEK